MHRAERGFTTKTNSVINLKKYEIQFPTIALTESVNCRNERQPFAMRGFATKIPLEGERALGAFSFGWIGFLTRRPLMRDVPPIPVRRALRTPCRRELVRCARLKGKAVGSRVADGLAVFCFFL
jgi:hypothetical protein